LGDSEPLKESAQDFLALESNFIKVTATVLPVRIGVAFGSLKGQIIFEETLRNAFNLGSSGIENLFSKVYSVASPEPPSGTVLKKVPTTAPQR
jgi:hypothetical protein